VKSEKGNGGTKGTEKSTKGHKESLRIFVAQPIFVPFGKLSVNKIDG